MIIVAYHNAFIMWVKNTDFTSWIPSPPKFEFKFNWGTGRIGKYLVHIRIGKHLYYNLVRVIYWKYEGQLEGITNYMEILKDFNINGERYLIIKSDYKEKKK